MQTQVVEAAKAPGWPVYYSCDARSFEPSFRTSALRGERQIIVELKARRGRLSWAQSKRPVFETATSTARDRCDLGNEPEVLLAAGQLARGRAGSVAIEFVLVAPRPCPLSVALR